MARIFSPIYIPVLMATGLAAGTALAQSNAASTSLTNTSPNPPAIATPNVETQTLAAPVAGANSFTQSQARERLESHGYSSVTDLKLDDEQIWRGKATKNGVPVNVALDYQGNIVAKP
jgi:hypothetical protein